MEQPWFGEDPPPLPREAAIFAYAVQQMVETNDADPAIHLQRTSPFHIPVKPSFNVVQLVRWIHRHTPQCEPTAYVVAYLYIRRFLETKEKMGVPFLVTSLNFKYLVLLGILIAAKNLTQRVYTNAHYALVVGMTKEKINALEVLFLSTLKFDLHVDAEEFESCCAYLECIHREREADAKKLRGPCEAGLRCTEDKLLARMEAWRLLDT